MKQIKNTRLEASLKSVDTEEWFDLLFYRPLGYRWALFFHRLGVSPNTVTVLSIFLGVAAGILFWPANLWLNLLGMFLLVWANTYDSADGQLARLTNQKTEWGRVLDGVSGDLWFIAIYAAICLRLTSVWSVWIWVLAAVAGFFHSRQAMLSDYYRNIHLYFLRGSSGSELRNSASEYARFRSQPWRAPYIPKLFQFLYAGYTRTQERMSPSFQRFYTALQQRYADAVPDDLRRDFRAGSLPLMKYTNILTFNCRSFAIFLTVGFDCPWLYFVLELTVFNALWLYMRHRHESLCRRLIRQYHLS